MRKWKSVVSAMLLTVLLIGLGLLNGAELATAYNWQIGERQVSYAAVGKFPEIRIKKPVRNEEGDLIGCIGKGKGCVVVVMNLGGRDHELFFTTELFPDVLLR